VNARRVPARGVFLVAALFLALAALAALASLVCGGCKRSARSASPDPTAAAAPAPTLVVREDSANLLLTWIDDKGDFHIETSVADVPMMGRDVVRVVDPDHEDTSRPDSFVIVDLRQAGADGNFPVRWMARADFEQLAVARREKAGPTLASAGPNAPPPPDRPAPADPSKVAARSVVVIYGAEWCGACHEAAKYLRSKGIPYVDKDVEKDPGAAAEMQQKLAKNGLHEGSIPVIDVRGKVMIGFNPAEIDAALGQAL
jgi:glutaredoxin